jgi:hypothetical protein
MSDFRKSNRQKVKKEITYEAEKNPDCPMCCCWIKHQRGRQTLLSVAIGGSDPLNCKLDNTTIQNFSQGIVNGMRQLGQIQLRKELIPESKWETLKWTLVIIHEIGRSFFDSVKPELKGTDAYKRQLGWYENFTVPAWA